MILATIAALMLGGGSARAECQFQFVPLPNNPTTTPPRPLGYLVVSVCVNENTSYNNAKQRGSGSEPVSVGVLVGANGGIFGGSGGGEQNTTTIKKTGKTIRVTTIGVAGSMGVPGTANTNPIGVSYSLGTTQRETKTSSRTDQKTTIGGTIFISVAQLPGSGIRISTEFREDRKGSTCNQSGFLTVIVAGGANTVGTSRVGEPLQGCPAGQMPRYPDFPKA